MDNTPRVSLRPSLKAPALLLVALAAAGTLVACSGAKASSGTKSTAAAATASTQSNPDGGPGGFRGLADNPQVKQCLDAAGITLPTPTFTGPRPTFSPGERPTFSPGTTPSFTRGPGAGGFFGGQNSAEFQKIQQALQACGITLPSRGPRPDVSGRPTSAPTA